MTRLESQDQFLVLDTEKYNEPNQTTSSVRFPIEKSRQEPITSFPLNKKNDAIDNFDKEIEAEQGSMIATYVSNANILLEACEYGLAMNLIRKVLELDPYHKVGMEQLARCFEGQGHFEKASRVRIQIQDLNPNAGNLLSLGNLCYGMGNIEVASDCYKEALLSTKLSSDQMFDAEKSLGNIALKQNDLDEAEEHYNRAFAINNRSDVLLVNYGTLEIQRRNYDKAVERFRDAVSINAGNDRGWLGLAIIHREYGDLELCWGNLEKALDINPENETAIQLMMDWGFKDNKMSKTIDRLERYIHLRPDDLNVNLVLAKVLYCTDQFNRALAEAERILAFDPSRTDVVDLIGLIKQKAKERIG